MSQIPITQRLSWVDKVGPCSNSSVGTAPNEDFRFGHSSSLRTNEDRYYNGACHNLQLCMVLDGHDGEKAVDYARYSLAGFILSNKLDVHDVPKVIEKAFIETEKSFFIALGDVIARRLALKSELNQRGMGRDLQRYYPQQVNELNRLNSQIKGGTTVVLSLICNNQLFTANVGDSRALLCQEINGQIIASQLSDDHNVFNPKEQERLGRIGISRQILLEYRRLGPFQVTRSIGDFVIKGGYQEVDFLRSAREEPGSCVPFINGPWDIRSLKKSFIILMSDGLYEAYGACINSRNPPELHNGLANMVVEEMRRNQLMEHVAMAVINRVRDKYKELYPKSGKDGRLDDISLIVQNLNYPVAALSGVMPDFERKKPAPPPPRPEPEKPVMTQEQIDSGKYIEPYIIFPSHIPFDLCLDDL